MSEILKSYDNWIDMNGGIAALVMHTELEPVEGKGRVFFPPTFAPKTKNEKSGYNIDYYNDGTNVCLVDSVGSQANRMEPIFKTAPFNQLVPQVIITFKDRSIHLLDVGHRAADALVRFSSLNTRISDAFNAILHDDYEPLAKIAPTSIVFGSWDSQATQAKLPRIIRSTIRAYNVKPQTRSAQYITIAGQILYSSSELEEKDPNSNEANVGLAHVPSTETHGGIIAEEIKKDLVISFSALRKVSAQNAERTMILRRYIFGLALVAAASPQEPYLRQGCELIPLKPTECQLVYFDGHREKIDLPKINEITNYAKTTAENFSIDQSASGEFDARSAQQAIKNAKKKKGIK